MSHTQVAVSQVQFWSSSVIGWQLKLLLSVLLAMQHIRHFKLTHYSASAKGFKLMRLFASYSFSREFLNFEDEFHPPLNKDLKYKKENRFFFTLTEVFFFNWGFLFHTNCMVLIDWYFERWYLASIKDFFQLYIMFEVMRVNCILNALSIERIL